VSDCLIGSKDAKTIICGDSKISQRSFAEFHSKRNFVERVHATETQALSRHRPFNSKQLHERGNPGTQAHLENMEKMADDIKDCLSNARFAGHFLECFRGIKDGGVFDNEDRLKEFLKLSKERKEECDWTYGPNSTSNPLFQALVQTWGVTLDFERKFVEDYHLIMQDNQDQRTAWKYKYSTTLDGPRNASKRFELQPVPDYVKWLSIIFSMKNYPFVRFV
jgi:hypothetical protein